MEKDLSKYMIRKLLLPLIILTAFSILFSCAKSDSIDVNKQNQKNPAYNDQNVENLNLRLAFSVTEFTVGLNRVRFGIIDPKTGPMKSMSVTAQTFYLGDGESEIPKDTQKARYYDWPQPGTGIYGIETSFDKPGKWGLGITIDTPESTRFASGYLTVKDKSNTPEIGNKIPTLNNLTLDDVKASNELTSDPDPYLPLYTTKITDSIDSDKSTLIVFSSPAFCKTGTCGPQLEIIKFLHPKFENEIDFIHIEIYKDPHKLSGKINKSDINPIVSTWNLPSEPWTFITDKSGKLTHKFEGLVTAGELNNAFEILK